MLLWVAGFLVGVGVGARWQWWRMRRFREDCLLIATRTFDALVEEWRAANEREETFGTRDR